jgi:arabinogalactan endo-1,4-beta-galactosidase
MLKLSTSGGVRIGRQRRSVAPVQRSRVVSDKLVRMNTRFFLGIFFVLTISVRAPAQDARLIGIDSNYVLEMEKYHRTWKVGPRPVDPYDLFARLGCRTARIRLWVGDDGPNRLTYATETARRMQQAGLKPFLVIFLSDEWADLVKQPLPAVWKDLSADQKLATIEASSERVVRHLAKNGIKVNTFEIGNEIDFGICGEFEEEWPRRVSLEFMRTKVWPRMVPILKAAQRGVLKAQPEAKFVIDLAQWTNVEYCIAFWQAMAAAGVKIDYPGLSYFPSSAKEPEQRRFGYLRTQCAKIVDTLHMPVLVCETGYPAAASFGGQFSNWNSPADGYPLNENGQAMWLADLVALVRSDRNFGGVIYFSPEWYNEAIWDAFALFNAEGVARPGIRSFQP